MIRDWRFSTYSCVLTAIYMETGLEHLLPPSEDAPSKWLESDSCERSSGVGYGDCFDYDAPNDGPWFSIATASYILPEPTVAFSGAVDRTQRLQLLAGAGDRAV